VTPSRADRLLPAVLFVVFALAAIAPIRSYDLFWHLASGRWIVEHRALPLMDPFALGSDREPWINGSWLAQVALYGAHAIVGIDGLSVLRGVLAACVFFLAARQSIPLAALAFAGAMPLFDMRPASIAALFVVLALTSRKPIAHLLIAILWINVHPSALLAPLIALLVTRRAAPVVASALGLLVNPYGVAAILAPIQLMSAVTSGAFVNVEWLPSRPELFPLLYVCVLIGIATIWRTEWWRVALFVLLTFLAIRHARHQPLFFAAFPLLVAPAIPKFDKRLGYAIAAASIAFAAITTDHHLGLARQRFPIEATARLKATGLRGNIYNADQFGGYLMWSFYPQRRVLTDGRNELYTTLIGEYAKARGDERVWRAFLAKYRIDLAVDEYRPRLDVVNAATRKVVKMPASLAYWPRDEWALIGHDGVAMVFARRAAFPPEVIARLETRRVVD